MQAVPKLEAAWAALDNQDFDRAVSAASPFLDAPETDVQMQARKVVGLVHFYRREYPAALDFLPAVAAHFDTARDWFNLAVAQTLAGQLDAGTTHFEMAIARRKAEQNTESAPNSPPTWAFLIFFYMQALIDIGEYRLALARLEMLRQIYESLGDTDDQQLLAQGVPVLFDVLEHAVIVLTEALPAADACSWLDAFAEKLDAQGKHTIAEFRERIARA